MNKIKVAHEILKIAQLISATEFPSQEALDAYLKEHPDADKSNHTVKKEEHKPEAPKTEDKKPEAPKKKKTDKVTEHAQKHLTKHGIYDVQKHVNKEVERARDSANMQHSLNGRDHPLTQKKHKVLRGLTKVKEKVDNHVKNYLKNWNQMIDKKKSHGGDENHPEVKKIQKNLDKMKTTIS